MTNCRILTAHDSEVVKPWDCKMFDFPEPLTVRDVWLGCTRIKTKRGCGGFSSLTIVFNPEVGVTVVRAVNQEPPYYYPEDHFKYCRGVYLD